MILKENVSLIYVYYYLFDFQKYLAEYITTGTQGNLNAQTVKGFKIQIPDIQEQTKIANFLSAIDEKINHFQLQIEKTENWKKGLLQQLFV
jgi:type I restriction enzyme S subunit